MIEFSWSTQHSSAHSREGTHRDQSNKYTKVKLGDFEFLLSLLTRSRDDFKTVAPPQSPHHYSTDSWGQQLRSLLCLRKLCRMKILSRWAQAPPLAGDYSFYAAGSLCEASTFSFSQICDLLSNLQEPSHPSQVEYSN